MQQRNSCVGDAGARREMGERTLPGERANTIVWGILNVALVVTGALLLSGVLLPRAAPYSPVSPEPSSFILGALGLISCLAWAGRLNRS